MTLGNPKHRSPSLINRLPDCAWICLELSAKHFYWSSAWLRYLSKRLHSPKTIQPQTVKRDDLKAFLQNIGVIEGSLVMAHTSVSNIQICDSSGIPFPGGFLAAANMLVTDLLEMLGDSGTLVMPTHPYYPEEDDSLPADKPGNAILNYDPKSTPCTVGIANELFWRRKNVSRSLHPYNSLAAYGPLAEDLLRDNLNDQKPLPHGVNSGYYRLCKLNGLIVSIGIPLRRCMTLLHVGEDVRDQDWPIKDFFEERRYSIKINGKDEIRVVRQCRTKYAKYAMCRIMPFNELIREGVIHEESVGNVPVGWAKAAEVLDYLMERNKNSTFPYYGIRLAALRK